MIFAVVQTGTEAIFLCSGLMSHVLSNHIYNLSHSSALIYSEYSNTLLLTIYNFHSPLAWKCVVSGFFLALVCPCSTNHQSLLIALGEYYCICGKVVKNTTNKTFVAPVGVTWNLITCLQWCHLSQHLVAKRDAGHMCYSNYYCSQ